MRLDVVGRLNLACAHWISTCKQKELSLEVKSSDWLHMKSSCIYTSSACNWCALGALDLKGTCFLKHKLVKCPYFMTRLTLVFLCWILECFFMFGHSTLRTHFFACMSLLRIKHFFGRPLALNVRGVRFEFHLEQITFQSHMDVSGKNSFMYLFEI